MNRRSFLAAIAAIPFVGKLVPKAEPDPLQTHLEGQFKGLSDRYKQIQDEDERPCPVCNGPHVKSGATCSQCRITCTQANELLDDLPFEERVGPHTHRIKTSLPSVRWRKIHEGVDPRRGR